MHWYGNVPAVVNVRDCVELLKFAMFAGAPATAFMVTLCVTPCVVQLTVPPTEMSTDAGTHVFPLLATFATAGNEVTTAMAVVPDTLPDAPVIVATPAPTPVTRPDDDTLATPDADDDHATVAEIALPFWSLVLAVNCTVPLTAIVLAGAEMEIDVSTGVTGVVVEPPLPEHAERTTAASASMRVGLNENMLPH